MFNKEKKEIRATQKALNKEFDAVIQAYDTSIETGDMMLKFYIEKWTKRMETKTEEVGA